jgi:hypothetical protein
MDTKEPKLEPPIDGAFLRTIQTHQGGKTITDLSAAIRDVTASVRQHSKPGKVILTMTIYPATKGHESAVGFECDVVEKLPRGENFGGLFFADEQNNLVRDNPQQQQLPALRTLENQDEEDEPLKRIDEV